MKTKEVIRIRPNLLGDLRAEADQVMLSRAFLETADFRTLIETSDRMIVVGRRGTGKSALTLKLSGHWRGSSSEKVIRIVPEDYNVIGARPLLKHFGDSFSVIRAGSKLAWRYALLMETALSLSPKHQFSNTEGYKKIKQRVSDWKGYGPNVVDRFSRLLEVSLDAVESPERNVGRLPVKLDLTVVEKSLSSACEESNTTVVFLIDKLDEGYSPDSIGIGLIDGLVQAAIEVKTRIPRIRPIIFLRDNIFRAVQANDPDFSRNIEGHVLRLHWNVDSLFNFATKRLSVAFETKEDTSAVKIWNDHTAGDLKGKQGFQDCLRLTLYRPRDLLSLLNEAYYEASKNGQEIIVREHIDATARYISQNRLDDLIKEYSSIIPGLKFYIGVFEGQSPELDGTSAATLYREMFDRKTDNSAALQDFYILGDAIGVLRSLYSVGFIGIKNRSSGTYVFCHDGRAPDQELSGDDSILVHPCYWTALNITQNGLTASEADEIFDEYDIHVSSETPIIRNERIKQLIGQLSDIPEGQEGSARFEQWCQSAIRICFAKGLRNVELKPNRAAKSRRDVVATNLGEGDAWRRIYDDYGSRQVTFEIKNYQGLKADDYYQILNYLTGEYGRLGFFVTRDERMDVLADKDLGWIREMYSKHNILVIKITAKWLARLLDKLKNPQKHDAVNRNMHTLLDTYARLYIEGQSKSKN